MSTKSHLEYKKEEKDHRNDTTLMDRKVSDALSISGDSGCNLSTSTEPADLTEFYQDFRVSIIDIEKVSNAVSNLLSCLMYISMIFIFLF